MKSICILSALALWICLSGAGAQETYLLSWSYEPGLLVVHKQTNQVEQCVWRLRPGSERKEKKLTNSRIALENLNFRQIEKSEEGKATVMVLFREGRVQYQSGPRTYSAHVESPKDQEKLERFCKESSGFASAVEQVSGGLHFVYDTAGKRVVQAERLKLVKIGNPPQYEAMPFPVSSLEDSIHEFPDGPVPVGHKWEKIRNHMGCQYIHQYEFKRVKTLKDKTLAEISISGQVKRMGAVVGSIEGIIVHDCENHVTAQRLIRYRKSVLVAHSDPKEGGRLEEEDRLERIEAVAMQRKE